MNLSLMYSLTPLMKSSNIPRPSLWPPYSLGAEISLKQGSVPVASRVIRHINQRLGG